jgi:F0F1-type ATP synthase membrane subunit a
MYSKVQLQQIARFYRQFDSKPKREKINDSLEEMIHFILSVVNTNLHKYIIKKQKSECFMNLFGWIFLSNNIQNTFFNL